MRYKILVWIIAVFISLATASAYTIDGDSVYLEDSNARLTVTPHTVDNPRFNWQYFTIDSKLAVSKDLCVAYVFDSLLNRTSAELLDGDVWNDVKGQFSHALFNDRHYYHTINPLSFDALESHTWRIRYDPMMNEGKWDLMMWDDNIGDCRETFITASYNKLYTLDPWFNTSLEHCRNVEFAGADAALTDFPHFVNITDTTDFNENLTGVQWVNAPCDAAGVEIPFEIENFTATNIDFWVKANASNTPYNISVYYDSENDDDFEDATNVWDNGYVGVWHHENGAGTLSNDSTSNANTGTVSDINRWTANGIVDNEYNYDGINDYANYTNLLGADSIFVVESWVNIDDLSTSRAIATEDDNVNRDLLLYVKNDGTVSFYVWIGGAAKNADTTASLSTDTWYHIAARYDNTNLYVYIDGIERAKVAQSGNIDNDGAQFNTGRRSDGGLWYDGGIDEIRLSSVDRSAAWIDYSYQLIGNASNYVTIYPQQNISTNTSYLAGKIDINDTTFASDIYTEISKDEIDLTGTGGNYFIVTSYNILKTSGGASNDVYMNISRDGVTLTDTRVRTVSGLNDEGSVVYFVNDSTTAAPHNISLSFRRSGVGSIEINDIDLTIGIASTNAGYNASIVNITTCNLTYSDTVFNNISNFTVTKDFTSDTFFMSRATMNASVASQADIRYRNIDTLDYSPIWSRYLSGSTDQGSVFGTWLDRDIGITHNYTIQAQTTAGTAQLDNTNLYLSLHDTDNNTVISEYDSLSETNLTSYIDYNAGTYTIGELNVTMLDGNSMFITAQATIGTQSLAQTPTLYINDSALDSDCYTKKERLLSGASDIGNIGFTHICENIGVGNSSTINLYMTVPTGETVRLYDEVLMGFEVTNITVTTQNIAPIWSQDFDNQSVQVGQSFSDNALFIDSDDLNASSNCTFLTVNVNNATDIVTINYTGIAAHENTTQYCYVAIDDSEFVTESNTFSINVTPAPPVVVPNGVDAYSLTFSGCDISTTASSIAIVGFSMLVVILNLAAYLVRFRLYSIVAGGFTWIFAFYVGACAFGLVYIFLMLGVTTLGHGLTGRFD